MTTDPSQTRRLLQAWYSGERPALDELLLRDLPWLRARMEQRLGRLLRRKGELDDYVHDAMVQVLQYGPRFVVSDREQFRALLARIVENVLRDKVEFLQAEKRNPDRERDVPSDSMLHLDPPVRSVARTSGIAHANEERAWIQLAIELLPAEDRQIVRLREWDGLSFAEIGERMGLAGNAARMRFVRALPRLARLVEQLQRGALDEALDQDDG